MSYRPITDVWILARAKLTGGHKLYGAFPGGFGERARDLLGVHIDDPVLHVCGGRTCRHEFYIGVDGDPDARRRLPSRVFFLPGHVSASCFRRALDAATGAP